MPNSDNALIEYEASQTLVEMVALTDSGDNTFFESADQLWSNKSGFAAVVRPDGVASGFAITPNAAADKIDIALGKVYQAGVLQSIGASAGKDVARPTATHIKYSITVDDSQTFVIVGGVEHTSFSTVRGADGGPPLIAVGSTEIAQAWLSSATPAVVTTSEIKQVPGSSQERFDFPQFNQTRINVENGVLGNAGATAVSALPLTHTGVIPKAIFAEYYTPEFTEWVNCTDFVPAETSNSTTSTPVYNNTLGATSSTLNQSTFTAYLADGISDIPLREKNSNIFWRFHQDRLNEPYIIQQGKLGTGRTFGADALVQSACTVSVETAAVDVYA